MRVGIHADSGHAELSRLGQRARRRPERPPRRGRPAPAARTARVGRPGVNRTQPASSPTLIAEGPQHALGVIARAAMRLPELDDHLAGEPGEQERALDLGTRHRQLVAQRYQRPAPHRERQAVAPTLLEPRTHPGERCRHPPHRAAAKRPIAGERGGERVRGEETEQETRGRTGVAAVERPVGTPKARAPADHDDGAWTEGRDLGPELAKHSRRAPGVERGERAADVARSPGE